MRLLKNSRFFKETKLMLEALPFVAQESCFALKGGTAINFFLRDMPRLSVDIDLTYLPIEDRATSLSGIKPTFEKEFQGMTTDPVSIDELIAARETMIAHLNSSLTADERAFLISVKEGAPHWELLKISGIENLPGLQWSEV